MSAEGLSLSASWREWHWHAERKNQDQKRLSSRHQCVGSKGGTQHVSMRMHRFLCESISRAGVHYQHNGLPGGCSCFRRLLASGGHSRPPCSGGGQRQSHRSGQASWCLCESSGWWRRENKSLHAFLFFLATVPCAQGSRSRYNKLHINKIEVKFLIALTEE